MPRLEKEFTKRLESEKVTSLPAIFLVGVAEKQVVK